MISPLSRHLVEFRPSSGRSDWSDAAEPGAEPPQRSLPPETVTLAVQLVEARQAGLAEGRRTAEDAARTASAEAETAWQAELAARFAAGRQHWVTDQADVLAERLRTGLAHLEDRLADGVAAILRPFVSDAVRVRAVADLRTAISSLVTNGPDHPIEVSGPADLIGALGEAFGEVPAVSLRVSEQLEVTVLAAPTVIRTRMQPWAARLDEALRSDA